MYKYTVLIISALSAAATALAAPSGAPSTLRSYGARGDGIADDAPLIQAALTKAAGAPIDGEGLTYAVNGTIDIRVPVNFRNAILKQTLVPMDTTRFIQAWKTGAPPDSIKPSGTLRKMVDGQPLMTAEAEAAYNQDPVLKPDEVDSLGKMINLRTLFIHGEKTKPVAINLERITIQRGNHPETGMHSNAAGIFISAASPLSITNVEITGDGKGAALFVDSAQNVRVNGLYIHDVHWAPYNGDISFTAAQYGGKDFGWNNSPIYDYQPNLKKFVRVRVQEQTNGFVIGSSSNIEITNTRIERVGTKIEGKFYPWQADGMTVGGCKNIAITSSTISQVWEGIDMTGSGVDGFLEQNVYISDCFSYCFKYAHPIKNGKVINCVADRAGLDGFTIGSECANISFTNCYARETGCYQFWWRDGKPANISGFDLDAREGQIPTNIVLKDCQAVNVKFPGSMRYGFSCGILATAPQLQNYLINPTAKGALEDNIHNFVVKK